MLPSTNSILTTNLNVEMQPSKQYRMEIETNRIVGSCEGLEAVKQAIYKILNTERYAYIIYSWDYGIELVDLYGKPPMYVCPELERRIKEALMQDSRIIKVDGFEFDLTKKKLVGVKFIVGTIFGDLKEGLVVNI